MNRDEMLNFLKNEARHLRDVRAELRNHRTRHDEARASDSGDFQRHR